MSIVAHILAKEEGCEWAEKGDFQKALKNAHVFENTKTTTTIKGSLFHEQNPDHFSLTVVGEFRNKIYEDKYLVYKINCRAMNNKPDYIFQTYVRNCPAYQL